MSEARDAVFASIRENLARDRSRGPRTTPPTLASPPAPTGESRIQRFVDVLAGLGTAVRRVPDEAAAAAAVQEVLSEAAVTRLALSDSALVQRLASTLSVPERIEATAPREQLLSAEAGLSCAQWGIAETGTLILESERERHRLVSLLPPLHIAILETRSLLDTLGEGLSAVHRDRVDQLDRAITFITGPSRTADIELTLVIGVHGPKRLHVILLDPESPT